MKNNSIKKGLGTYLYYWTIVGFLIFLLINYFFKDFKTENLNVGMMISAVTFLFGLLVGSNFSMLRSRLGNLKEVMAIETGRFINLFYLSEKLGGKFHEQIKKRIDRYTIQALSYFQKYEAGRKEIFGIYKDLDLVKPKSKSQELYLRLFLFNLGEIMPIRRKIEYFSKKYQITAMKFVNYALGFILILLLFLNRSNFFTEVLFVILSTIVIFVLLIIEDYDDLKIGAYTLGVSNAEQIFDLIGEKRYYPKKLLKNAEIKKGDICRVGYFDKQSKKHIVKEVKF